MFQRKVSKPKLTGECSATLNRASRQVETAKVSFRQARGHGNEICGISTTDLENAAGLHWRRIQTT
jgi:hypothetical protein